MTGVIAQLEAATHRLVDHLASELRALGLTPGEVNALAHLRADAPLAVAELQAATGQRPSTLTGVIDRLERRGLATRAVNARDRRSFVVELTPEGERAAQAVEVAFEAVEARARLDERDVAAFHRVLRALGARGGVKLRCVFYDPDAVDADDRMTARALEACERAGVEVYELAGDEDVVVVAGEEHAVPEDTGPFEFVLRAHGLESGEAIAVGARLEGAPVGAIWVGPLDLEVRGENVRVAEDADQLLYDAVITELAERR